jgi:hypothetical protein
MPENNVQTGQLVNQTAGELIAEGKAIQQIQTNYTTAVSVLKPRNLSEVINRCIAEAELSGELFYYQWPAKTKGKVSGTIEGPSVQLALAAIRNYGNMVCQQRPVQETRNCYIFTSAIVDLETGFTLERQFRMDKGFTVYGKMDEFRKADIRFQIGQSKAIRNVVTNAVPATIIDKMMKAAKGSVRKAIEEKLRKAGGDFLAVANNMLQAFEKVGVTTAMIEKSLNLTLDKWDVETLTLLAGDLKALVNGNETADTLYPAEETDDKPEQKAGISTDDMKVGDAETHQPYKDKPSTKVVPGKTFVAGDNVPKKDDKKDKKPF